jgi:hypothetical protein
VIEITAGVARDDDDDLQISGAISDIASREEFRAHPESTYPL